MPADADQHFQIAQRGDERAIVFRGKRLIDPTRHVVGSNIDALPALTDDDADGSPRQRSEPGRNLPILWPQARDESKRAGVAPEDVDAGFACWSFGHRKHLYARVSGRASHFAADPRERTSLRAWEPASPDGKPGGRDPTDPFARIARARSCRTGARIRARRRAHRPFVQRLPSGRCATHGHRRDASVDRRVRG